MATRSETLSVVQRNIKPIKSETLAQTQRNIKEAFSETLGGTKRRVYLAYPQVPYSDYSLWMDGNEQSSGAGIITHGDMGLSWNSAMSVGTTSKGYKSWQGGGQTGNITALYGNSEFTMFLCTTLTPTEANWHMVEGTGNSGYSWFLRMRPPSVSYQFDVQTENTWRQYIGNPYVAQGVYVIRSRSLNTLDFWLNGNMGDYGGWLHNHSAAANVLLHKFFPMGLYGWLHEVLLYRRAMSDAELGVVYTYLANKWR